MQGPRFLYITTNQRCNLRCAHCRFWELKNRDQGAFRARRDMVIAEFAEIAGEDPAVCICGGENLLDPVPFYATTRQCRRLGLRCLAVINGTIKHDSIRLLQEGPTQLTLSLDSPYEALHDAIRGVGGAWRRTVGAARDLVNLRPQVSPETPLYAMAVISERNYRDLDAFFDFVLNDLGLDKLKLNFLQPTFGGSAPDSYFADNVVKNIDELIDIIVDVGTKYNQKWNPGWLESVYDYHRSIAANGDAIDGWSHRGRTRLHICNSYDRNIMVDSDGVARLCYFPDFSSAPLQVPGDLTRFWFGANRSEMRRCNRYCGISHSVRREQARCG